MEEGLDAELSDELGYGKYNYKNKETENSRNSRRSKTLRTSFGKVDVPIPRDWKGEFEPQLLKKNQSTISQDIEEKLLSIYAKRDDDWGYRDPYQGHLWSGSLRYNGEPDHRQDSPRGEGMVATAAGKCLRAGISGRLPLPCPQ